MRVRPRMAGFLRPHSGSILLATFAAVSYAVLDATTYVLLIPFVDALFVSGGSAQSSGNNAAQALLDATVYSWVDLTGDPLVAIERIIILILCVFLLKNIFAFTRVYLLAQAEQGVSRDLRDAVYDHLLDLDLGFFGRTRTGQIVSRLTTEIEQFRTLVTRELGRLFSSVFEFLGALVFMLLISWKLTLAAFVVIPLAMGVWGPLVHILRRRDRRAVDLGAEVNAHIVETVAGVRLVKSSSAEGLERARFHRLTADYYRHFMKAEWARSLAAPMTEVLAAVGTAVILWYGSRLVVGAEVTGAQFVGFLGLSLKLYAPVKNVAKFPAIAQPGLVAAERVFEFLDTEPRITDRPGAKSIHDFEHEIVYDRVSFAYYQGPPVLEDLCFRVPRGTVVALVGPSGAGKSTVVDLLSRFFEVSGGSISIDGVDVRDVRVSDLRSLMAIVAQETILFHDTVASNIAYGRPGATGHEVEAASHAANAHEFIVRLPDGYDTVVGERGVELSGGQRQRIAIARAILSDAPILVFDEATSALDTKSERLIQDALARLVEGRTVFVVAHRLSTVQRADQILVLEDGRLVEHGDHETLLAQSGRYRALHDLQFGLTPMVAEQ
ncbi:ABC transporter ATP-binding protein/permease [Gemmatimonadales bacterium]|nr:ABC transporter ATP-binding protein/permease [Gemmatimonadales bacterium]